MRLDEIARRPTDGPRPALVVTPDAGGRGTKQVRYVPLVEIGTHCVVGGRAEDAEHRQDIVALNQLPGQFNRLCRNQSIVARQELDLSPVDTPLAVDLVEIARLGNAGYAIGSGISAIGHRVADADFRLANPGTGVAGSAHPMRRREGRSRGCRYKQATPRQHYSAAALWAAMSGENWRQSWPDGKVRASARMAPKSISSERHGIVPSR